MSVVRQLKKVLLGETWLLPLGLAALLLGLGLVVQPLAGDAWAHAGGFALLAGVVALLVVSVARDA